MKKILSGFMALALAAGVSTAEAQVERPVQFGLAGGLSFPTGDAGDFLNTGYQIKGMVGLMRPGSPLGVRFDVDYNDFGSDVGNQSLNVIGGSVNGILGMGAATAGGVMPYVTAGAGIYRSKFDVQDPTVSPPRLVEVSSTDAGLSGGAGLRFNLAGLSTFVEARYMTLFTEGDRTNFVPLVFGIVF